MGEEAQATSEQSLERSTDHHTPDEAAALSTSENNSTAQIGAPIDPSPPPPPPNEATARRMEEIRDQLVSLLTKHQAPRQMVPSSDLDACGRQRLETPIAIWRFYAHPNKHGGGSLHFFRDIWRSSDIHCESNEPEKSFSYQRSGLRNVRRESEIVH